MEQGLDSHDEKTPADATPAAALPAVDEVQRVEAEPMDGERHYRFGKAAPHFQRESVHVRSSAGHGMQFMKPPVLATWICLAAAWFFLGSKIPFTVFLGVPFSLVALFLAAVCLSRGGVITGMLVMLLGSAGSFVVYLLGLARFLIRL